MRQILVNYKKNRSLLGFRFVSLHVSLDTEGKKGFFKYNRLRFSKKVQGLMVFAIIAVLLVSVFAWLSTGTQSTPSTVQLVSNGTIVAPSPTGQQTSTPTQTKTPTGLSDIGQIINQAATDIFIQHRPPGLIESSQNVNSTMWKEVAAIAWRYFQPGVGVDSNTGLPRAGGTDSPNFTDWDLGIYIQAVVDATATKLIGNEGAWGSSARLETVVNFLETRELNSYNYPYWFYQAGDGKPYRANSDLATSPVDGIDTGRLFVALNNLKTFNYSLAQRIDTIVKGPGNRSNYAALVPNIKQESLTSNSIYFYYIANGFAGFWPNELSNATNTILNNIISAGNVTTPEGVSLPLAAILGDPLLCSVFETSYNSHLMAITRQVYLAHEAYYNKTYQDTGQGQYRAFSEGSSLSTYWVYEWVVLPDGRTWVILGGAADNNISPIIYTKIAVGFLAIYNTTYARDMVVYLEKTLPDPANGYCEGVDESGAQLTVVGLHTNGLIIEAAKYAIQNNP
jgi:hypothetical protein